MQRRVQEDEVVEIVMSEDEASEGAAYGRREDSIGNSSLEKDGNLSSDNSVSAEPISNTRGGGGGHGGGEVSLFATKEFFNMVASFPLVHYST